MPRNPPTSRPSGPRQYALELQFAAEARRLPPRDRPALLRWLRHYRRALTRRRRPPRTFYELDPLTGQWHQL